MNQISDAWDCVFAFERCFLYIRMRQSYTPAWKPNFASEAHIEGPPESNILLLVRAVIELFFLIKYQVQLRKTLCVSACNP